MATIRLFSCLILACLLCSCVSSELANDSLYISELPEYAGKHGPEFLPIIYPAPNFPRKAVKEGIEGHVVLEFEITKVGIPANAKIVESEPHGIFDKAALKAIRKWRYKPRTLEGKAVHVRGVRTMMTFRLD